MMIPDGTFDTSVPGHFTNDEFVFFWGGPFSNWDASPFNTTIVDLFGQEHNIRVNCSEQAMMLWKAALHGDVESWAKILKATHPAEQKKLGRQISNFNDEHWASTREPLAEQYLYDKFTQCEYHKSVLLNSENRILVEASPFDAIWGIKMGMNHYPDILNPTLWQGQNLLGVCLMRVRNRIMNEDK